MDIAILILVLGLFTALLVIAVRKLRRRTDAYPDSPPFRGRPGAGDREPRRPLVPAGSASAAVPPPPPEPSGDDLDAIGEQTVAPTGSPERRAG